MEIQTNHSYLKTLAFDNKELLSECVRDVTNLLPIKVYGKECRQRRCIGFFSDESIGYKYSSPKPLTKSLKLLLSDINHLFNTNYNGILVNKYKSGEDYISKHSDDEKNLDDSGVISISYGATRKFRIRDKKTNLIVKDIPLLQMGGQFQHEFTHEIPVEKKVKEPLWGHPKPLWGHPKPRCNFVSIDVGKLIKKQTSLERLSNHSVNIHKIPATDLFIIILILSQSSGHIATHDERIIFFFFCINRCWEAYEKNKQERKTTNKVIMNGTLRVTFKSLCEYRQNTSNRPVYYYITSLSVLRSHSNPR